MQSGIDSSRGRIDAYLESTRPTKIDIRPEHSTLGESDIFGKEGLSFRDALDAINPLNHIPIISDIVKEQTGHEVSVASKLAGGTLFGGPIGFAIALAGVIFEGETGKSPAGAVYAALTSEEETTDIAANSTPELSEVHDELAQAVPDIDPPAKRLAQVNFGSDTIEVASLEPQLAAQMRRDADLVTSPVAPKPRPKNDTILELYGASTASAHHSYQKAQLRPYLRDVTVSKVL